MSTEDKPNLEQESKLLAGSSLPEKSQRLFKGEDLASDRSQTPLIQGSPFHQTASELATPRLPAKRQWRIICRAAIKRLVSQGCRMASLPKTTLWLALLLIASLLDEPCLS